MEQRAGAAAGSRPASTEPAQPLFIAALRRSVRSRGIRKLPCRVVQLAEIGLLELKIAKLQYYLGMNSGIT